MKKIEPKSSVISVLKIVLANIDITIVKTTPIPLPNAEINPDSNINSNNILDLVAPIDFFIPISFVFSFTTSNSYLPCHNRVNMLIVRNVIYFKNMS